MTATLKRRVLAPDTWATIASRLAEKLDAWGQPLTSHQIARALHDLLDGQDQSARELRAAVQIHLAIVASESVASDVVADGKNVEMLSTEQAAQLMGCSRPYVAMLIDADKLAGGVTSKGGHRKVPKSSVLQWIADKSAATIDKDYRKAAADSGMYAIPDAEYVKAAKRGG
ncbi:excisionase family DNA-binding protein [Duganella sp. FT27W]|uniref:excisionase family DNA-binding protein n=1 Tax=Duganella sp. FT27W TaxID=2654636 RepID=UPI00128CB233|nr:excisionase family DNA-binding protein [Duganella sp. FT27W]MPQ58140.1 helix-turn-helix domain-containing protein [Duganella sp. FT27W]